MNVLQKNLFHKNLFWFANSHSKSFSSLKYNLRCQYCIIGGGISGLTAAYYLAKAGKNVAIIESKYIGSGTTGQTTAHLTYALHERYYQIIESQGEKIARFAADYHNQAITNIDHIIQNEKIDCDFEYVPGYLFSTQSQDKYINKEFYTTSDMGIPVKFEDHSEILPYTCIKFDKQAQFHPLKFLYHLANIIYKDENTIWENTAINKIVKHKSHLLLETCHGHTILCDHVINATNQPINNNDTKRSAVKTYVIAAIIPKDSIARGLYWDNTEPYHYIRCYQTHNALLPTENDIVIIGGEDQRLGLENPDVAFQNLQLYAKQHFPQIKRICYQWSGYVYDRSHYLDFLKIHYTNKPIVISIINGSSNGLTHGSIAALKSAEVLLN